MLFLFYFHQHPFLLTRNIFYPAMKTSLSLPTFTRDRENLLSMRQIELQKHILKRRKSRQPSDLTHSSSSLNTFLNNPLSNAASTCLPFGGFPKHGCTLCLDSLDGKGSPRVRVPKRTINWEVLKEHLHRPKHDRWQRKFVNKLARTGNIERVLKLLN